MEVEWVVMNGCECNSLIFNVTEFLNPCQNGDKCINVLWNCVENQLYFHGINESYFHGINESHLMF
jgi:hypothetical protein